MKNIYTNNSTHSYWLSKISLALLVAALLSISIYGVAMAASEHNNVKPSVTEEVNGPDKAGSLVTEIYKPYLVEITDGTSVFTTPTTSEDPEIIIDDAGIPLRLEDRVIVQSKDASNDSLIGIRITINRAAKVTLNLRGAKTNLYTQSKTVEELLSEQGIVLGANDEVKPSLSTTITDSLNVAVHKVGTETVVLEENVEFKQTFIDDSTIAYGTKKIKTPGSRGSEKNTYKITYNDGVEVSRVKIKSSPVKQAINEVIIRGTKGKPASRGPLSPEQIQFLGGCEAGMNPTRNSGNGYYGAFQFSIGTWNAMGTGYARADLAPLDVQIQAVQNLLSRSSIFGQFPGCANKMVAAGLL